MRSSLALLAALGAALALAGAGDGAPSEPPASAGASGAEPGVALRISASEPAAIAPDLLERFATASGSAAVPDAVRRVERALAREGIDAEGRLLAPLTSLSVSLERSCPPPAVLGCRPAIRVCGGLRATPSARYWRRFRGAVRAGLRAGGFRAPAAAGASKPGRAGRVTSEHETLARWRLDGDLLELATGGLALRGCETPPAAVIEVERDAQELALLLDDRP